jgi:hypothetical protein
MHRLRGAESKSQVNSSSVPREILAVAMAVLMFGMAVLNIGFASGVLVWVLSWLLFILNEKASMHSSQEVENRFTFLSSSYLVAILVFTSESPLGWVGRRFPYFGGSLVAACGFIICVWHRSVVRCACPASHSAV